MTSTTQLLRKILSEGNARTQSEIQFALKEYGVTSSQSKISRLLHQIGAIKLIDSQGKTQYRLPHEAGLLHELAAPQEKTATKQWVLDVVANESLIVIHTTPAAAMLIARMIDQNRKDLNILGTIAGDDTIIVVPKQITHIAEIRDAVINFLDL